LPLGLKDSWIVVWSKQLDWKGKSNLLKLGFWAGDQQLCLAIYGISYGVGNHSKHLYWALTCYPFTILSFLYNSVWPFHSLTFLGPPKPSTFWRSVVTQFSKDQFSKERRKISNERYFNDQPRLRKEILALFENCFWQFLKWLRNLRSKTPIFFNLMHNWVQEFSNFKTCRIKLE
jgi:hypothetical protein